MNPNSNLFLFSLTAIFLLTFNSCSDDHESDMQDIAGDTRDQLDGFISEKYSSYTKLQPSLLQPILQFNCYFITLHDKNIVQCINFTTEKKKQLCSKQSRNAPKDRPK